MNRTIWQRVKDLWSGNSPHPVAVMAAVGCISMLAYILFAILPTLVPGTDWSNFPPYIGLPQVGGFDLSNYYLLYSVICINALFLFGLYMLSVRLSGLNPRESARLQTEEPGIDGTTRLIFIFAVLFHVVMFATPYLLSTDLFDYIRHGRIFAIYGENPLTVPATYFPQDPFFPLGGWVGTGSVYGPLHVYVAGALARIAGDGIGANLMIFKGFFILMNLANVLLIGIIARKLKPGLEKKAMLFYGWNPFILTLVVANAHNDIIMLTFVLIGILCYLHERVLLGVVAITLATLVKFIALPVLVIYIALAVRRQAGLRMRIVTGLLGAGIATAVSALSYIPVWQGRETFNYLLTVGQKTNFTIPSLLRDITAGHLELSLSNTIVQLSLAALLGAYVIWHALSVKDTDEMLSVAAGIAFLTPLALFWFQPWYLTLGMGLVALRPWRFMYLSALVFSFSVMFFDSFWWHSPVSMDIQKPLRAAVVFAPPILLLTVLKARELLPSGWRRVIRWSLQESAPVRAEADVSDPSLLRLGFELAALVTAAVVPMALVVSSSPQLRALADLLALKIKLLLNL